jgi:hypothetical protein
MDRLVSDAGGRIRGYSSDLGTTDITKEDLQIITLSKPVYAFSPIKNLTTEDNFLQNISNRNCMVNFVVYANGKPVGFIYVKKEGSSFSIVQVGVGESYAIAADKAIKTLGDGEVIALWCNGIGFFANLQDEVLLVSAAPIDKERPIVTLKELGDAVDKNLREIYRTYPDGNSPPGSSFILEFLYEGKEEILQPLDSQALNNQILYVIIVVLVIFKGSMTYVYVISKKRSNR